MLDDGQYMEDSILTCPHYNKLCNKKDELQDKNNALAKQNL